MRKFIIIGLIVFVCGCNTLKKLDKSEEYKKVDHYNKGLVVPSDLNRDIFESDYSIPG